MRALVRTRAHDDGAGSDLAPHTSQYRGILLRGYRDRLDQSPACLNVLDFKTPVRARLMLFNDVSHYVDQPPRADGRLSKWWDG